MAYIAFEKLDDTQAMTVRILREFGTGRIYLHNDRQEGLVSAKAVEILEAMGIIEVLPPDPEDPKQLMRCKIVDTAEPMGEKIQVRFDRDWTTHCILDARRPTIPMGTHTMIRVANPGSPASPWLVLESDPNVGQAEDSLRIFPLHVIFLDDLIATAIERGLRLVDFADGEDVTGFRAKLNRMTVSPVSYAEAMQVIETLAMLQPQGVK